MAKTLKYCFLIKDHKLENNLEPFDVGIIVNAQGENYSVKFLRENKEILTHRNYIKFFKISETGDEFVNKVCDRCFKYLNTANMYEDNRIKKGGKKTKRPSCRACRKIKNGKSISKKDRNSWNLQKPSEYSPFTCPICEKTTICGISKIVLDHCHQTGNVRGWICESCNTGIGRFDDDPDVVFRAIEWLKR